MALKVEEDYVVEELVEEDLPEAELAQFTEVQPLRPQVDELIRKFVDGELNTLPATFNTLEPDEEQDEYAEDEIEYKPILPKLQINSPTHDDLQSPLPSTSAAAAFAAACAATSAAASGGGGSSLSRAHRKRSALPQALQGLMGQANMCFVRGHVDIAEKLCFEIIRQQPYASEPFFTLANIYEGRDTEKLMKILSVAAHLDSTTRDHWIRLADLYIERGNMDQAIVFYSKAIRAIPKDYDMRVRKAQLLEKMGQQRSAMFTLLKMIPILPAEEKEFGLITARKVMRYFYDNDRPLLALEAMENAFDVCGSSFTTQDYNMYFELLILQKNYSKVVDILVSHLNVMIEKEREKGTEEEMIVCCVIPDDLLHEFRSKLCVCLIQMGVFHLLEYLISNVHDRIPVEYECLELYIDIAEALMQQQKYGEALTLLEPISQSTHLDCPAFVWLKVAECLRHLNRTNEAIEAYSTVVTLAPFFYEAKCTLSALLKQQGRHMEAIKALEEYDNSGSQPLNARLLYERCIMLQHIGHVDDFLELGYKLLSRYSLELMSRAELDMVAGGGGGGPYNPEGIKRVLSLRSSIKGETAEELLENFNKLKMEDADLSIDDEFSLFRDLLRTAANLKRYAYAQKLCFTMALTKRFTKYSRELERLMVLSSFYNDDCSVAFTYLHKMIVKAPENPMLWQMLGLMVQKKECTRYHRFVDRLLPKLPNLRSMRIFTAHYQLYSISFKNALNIFTPFFKEQPNAHIALCIAAIFVQMAMQRRVENKSACLGQAIAFIQKYAELRGGVNDDNPAKQEILFNIGRIYQHAGINHIAMNYYEQALAVHHEFIEERKEILGLTEEIAFNLHLIYLASGNKRKARHILHKYIVT